MSGDYARQFLVPAGRLCRQVEWSHSRHGRAASEIERAYVRDLKTFKQSATRAARIEKAMPAIFASRGFLERR
jgi:hypothetical protein